MIEIEKSNKALFQELEEIKLIIDKRDYRRFSLRTLNNFITSLDKLKSDEYELAYKKLSDYLNIIRNNSTRLTPHETYELYSDYLKPLVSYYEKLGFKNFIGWRNIAVFGLPLNIFLFILDSHVIFYFIVNYLLLIFKLRSNYFSRKKLCFGPFY